MFKITKLQKELKRIPLNFMFAYLYGKKCLNSWTKNLALYEY